jgi:hypothetical protein
LNAKQPSVLLIIPPLTQLNTPYPATTALKAFLQQKGVRVWQVDLGIELINRLFTSTELSKVFVAVRAMPSISESAKRVLAQKEAYLARIDYVMAFLKNPDTVTALMLVKQGFLPQGAHFNNDADEEWAFGVMGTTDKAKRMATLFLLDIAEFIRDCICEHFELVKYGEKLCASLPDFSPLKHALDQPESLIDKLMLTILDEILVDEKPVLVGFTVPFPGNLYAALRCSAWVRTTYGIKTIIGGGYPNTELRWMKDARLFNYVDFVGFDDGEQPLWSVVRHVIGQIEVKQVIRCAFRDNGQLFFTENEAEEEAAFNQLPVPDFEGLERSKYLSLNEVTNPMHRLWGDGFWNKMTLAHGCYWAKCAFCDTTLSYIKHYSSVPASSVVDKMEAIIKQTGSTGFHFTDEAAPPALLKNISLEILKRRLIVSWWTNIRFETAFTPGLCQLMSKAGCIAVTGGLETASDRLLTLMNKGVSLAQAARATAAFSDAGIMVHAYLMYGFPSQTLAETVDSLEIVRQLFENGFVQSAFWHKFALTIHSPVAKNPKSFGIHVLDSSVADFATNEIPYIDRSLGNDLKLAKPLNKAVYNYMHGLGFEIPVNEWFGFKDPKTKILPDYIQQLGKHLPDTTSLSRKHMVWLGNAFELELLPKKDKAYIQFSGAAQSTRILIPLKIGQWFLENALSFDPVEGTPLSVTNFFAKCSELYGLEPAEVVYSKWWNGLTNNGLCVI